MAWWQQLKESRRQAGKQRHNSWERLNKHMRRNFLPYNYDRTLYNKLQNLRQGNRSVEEYATDFFNYAARVPAAESETQMIARFIGGLRPQLQNALQQFKPLSVSEVHQRAAAMEVQLRASWTSNSSRPRSQQTSFSEVQTTNKIDGQTTQADTSITNNTIDTSTSSRPARTNALRCFTCGKRGHIQTACPKQTRRGLVIQDADDTSPLFDESESDHEDTEDVIHGDTGVCLVLRRSCLQPQPSQESWLRSNLFRTCTIQGKICKLIIDSGSCSNVIAQEAVCKLGFKTTPHPAPYKLAWLNSDTDLFVSRQSLVAFSIGTYKEEVLCDVAPMDACHLLLGRPWQYDRDTLIRDVRTHIDLRLGIGQSLCFHRTSILKPPLPAWMIKTRSNKINRPNLSSHYLKQHWRQNLTRPPPCFP